MALHFPRYSALFCGMKTILGYSQFNHSLIVGNDDNSFYLLICVISLVSGLFAFMYLAFLDLHDWPI